MKAKQEGEVEYYFSKSKSGTGAIIGDDGKRYIFNRYYIVPRNAKLWAGLRVSFIPSKSASRNLCAKEVTRI